MKILTFKWQGKICDGAGALGLSDAMKSDRSIADLTAALPANEESLLLWHDKPSRSKNDLKSLLATPGLWILCASTEGVDAREEDDPDFLARVKGIPWSLPSVKTWEEQSPWKRKILSAFLAATDSLKVGPPPWHLLVAPVPEHVLACYLCTLGQVAAAAPWKEEFEREVARWRRQGLVDDLDWENRQNVESLRKFLVRAGVLSPAAK